LSYGAGHRQIQQSFGFMLAVIQLCFAFIDHGIDAPGHQLGLAHGIANSFGYNLAVLRCLAEIVDQGPVKYLRRDA
jgi:hypothetical protein